jgi:hypothetical protein
MMFYVGFLVAELPTQFLAQRISRLGNQRHALGHRFGQHGSMHLLR